MNQLDAHSARLKKNVLAFGRPVTLRDPAGNEYPLTALWNDVEHVLKLETVSGDPMGARSSLYIDRDSLQTESGEITPANGWTAYGSPNAYDDEKRYIISISKQDRQLPGLLLFISPENSGAEAWPDPEAAT